MRSCWIKSEGGKPVFEFRDIPKPQPGAGEILVRTHAVSLNRGELLASIGWHSAEVPKPGGRDVAGEVEAWGEGVEGFTRGQRVMASAQGTFADYVRISAPQAMPIPENLDWAHAAAIPAAYRTAHVSLFTYGRVAAGDWVLVAGAASGVGVACVQIAKHVGARVIGTTRSAEKLEALKALGLDVGIQASSEDFSAQVLDATSGRGVNVAVNMVGGSVFPHCLRSLANQGRLVIVGYVDGVMNNEIDLEAVHEKRLEISGVSGAHVTKIQRDEGTHRFVQDLMPAFASGRIVPAISRVFAFDELPQAKAYVESDAHVGKVIVRLI